MAELDRDALAVFKDRFRAPSFRNAPVDGYEAERQANPAFRSWSDTNLHQHRVEGYASVVVTFNSPNTSSSLSRIRAAAASSDRPAAAIAGWAAER